MELEGAVDPRVLEQVPHRDHLGDHGDVLPRVERNHHQRQVDIQNRGRFLAQSGAIVVGGVAPLFELNDDLDALLLPRRVDAEERPYVDDPDAPDLHVVLLLLETPAQQDVVSAARDHDDVVGDVTMSPLHEIEHTLALADAALPDKKQAHAVDIRKRPVHDARRRKLIVEVRLDAAVELAGLELGLDERDAVLVGRHLQRLRRIHPLGDEEARNIGAKDELRRRALRLRVQRPQKSHLCLAEDLNPAARKPLDEPRESDARTRDVGALYLPVQTLLTRDDLQREALSLSLEQLAYSQRLQAVGSSVGMFRRSLLTALWSLYRERLFFSWRASLATTLSRAVRKSAASAWA